MQNEIVFDESGQDLIEYTLLLAFVCLVGAGFYIGVGQNVNVLWSIVNSRLSNASSSATSSS